MFGPGLVVAGPVAVAVRIPVVQRVGPECLPAVEIAGFALAGIAELVAELAEKSLVAVGPAELVAE